MDVTTHQQSLNNLVVIPSSDVIPREEESTNSTCVNRHRSKRKKRSENLSMNDFLSFKRMFWTVRNAPRMDADK
jgi:hypothetical protein